MKIPDFLEVDLNNLKRTNNAFQKFHKIIYFNITLLKYLVIILYHSSKLTEYKNNKISKMLYNNFAIPTEGVWLSLLELLLSCKFVGLDKPNRIFEINLANEDIRKFNQVYSLFIANNLEHNDHLSIKEYFKRIISIKNRLVSHSLVSEEKAIQIIDAINPITEQLLEHLKSLLITPLILLEENELEADLYCEVIIGDINEYSLPKDQFSEDGLYLMYNSNIIFTSPFLICRDGHIYIYNKFDSKNKKILYCGSNNKEIYVKTAYSEISEIFDIDKEALNIKPIPVQIKISRNNVYHNLPNTDYHEFIGRKAELNTLNNMVLHKRHFISALDGIGGVGKSAMALEFCNQIFTAKPGQDLYFEYIIWLSAKTTILKDGEIYYINQAFEHLEQLLDTILDVLDFSEYKAMENKHKQKIVLDLLGATKALVILDNLETIKKDNLSEIWSFINSIPDPSKTLLTSREFHYDVPQTLRIDNLSDEDAILFIKGHCLSIKLDYEKIEELVPQIIQLASGLPIALKSILGQLYLGRNFRAIRKGIEENSDNLSKFCFKEQLRLLKEDHIKVLLLICLATEDLDYDAISYMIEPLINSSLLKIINELSSLSIIKINHTEENDVYSILPLIKTYIFSTTNNEELIIQLKEKLSEYYQLKESDTYTLLPIEERSIDKGSLIPRKLVDKAMKHSDAGEMAEAENYFRKVIKDYPTESYVWYMYAMYLAQFPSTLSDAINALKRADELSSNYIYNKKIGDYHLRLKNYQAAVKNYRTAMQKAKVDQNKNEMFYLIGSAEYERAKHIRQLIRRRTGNATIEERNEAYKNSIENLLVYIQTQPKIYEGKSIKIYRLLAEAHFGLKQKDHALKYIDIAIELSDNDETHINYKKFIETGERI